MNLSSKQYDVLDFIKKFIASKGYSPTMREIAKGMGYKSPSTAQESVKKLVQSGIITYDARKNRTIELLVQNEYMQGSETTASIPVLDEIDNSVIREFIEIPTFMLNDYAPKNLYAFRQEKNIYIINVGLKLAGKPSLVIRDDKFYIEDEATKNIFGNVVSQFTVY